MLFCSLKTTPQSQLQLLLLLLVSTAFAAGVAQQATCGGILVNSGSITYSGASSSSSQCTWTLIAASGRSLVIEFVKFTLSNQDVLSVFSGNALVANYTGSKLPPTLTLGTSARIVASSSATAKQRSGAFVLIVMSQVLYCGGLNIGSGVITSPNYPRSYPNNIKCIWTLVAPPGKLLRLQFTAIYLEGTNKDTIIVYSGPESLRVYGSTVAVSERSPATLSAAMTATVVFRSDGTGQQRGFRLVVSSVAAPRAY